MFKIITGGRIITRCKIAAGLRIVFGLFAFLLSSVFVMPSFCLAQSQVEREPERAERAGRVMLTLPSSLGEIFTDPLLFELGDVQLGNIQISVFSQHYLAEQWDNDFPALRKGNDGYQLALIYEQDVSAIIGKTAHLFARTQFNELLLITIFVKISPSLIMRFDEVHKKIQTGNPPFKETAWDISAKDMDKFCQPVLALVKQYVPKLENPPANAFYLKNGYFEALPSQHERISFFITEDYNKLKSPANPGKLTRGTVAIKITCTNIGYPARLELLQPLPAPPIPTYAKEIIRQGQSSIAGSQGQEKIILKAYEHNKETIGIDATASVYTRKYNLQISMTVPEQEKANALKLWDKVLDGLQVNY